MVEPTTGDMTFIVPRELHTRAHTTYAAYAQALRLATDQPTVAHARALSVARGRLAAAYRELASVFRGSAVFFEAFDRMAAQHFDDAIADDRWADRLQASTFGGEQE